MVDSGSFTHAIDAETELPDHNIVPLSSSENPNDAESACGHIMKRHGRVRTLGTVEGVSLPIKWDAMQVKVPIL